MGEDKDQAKNQKEAVRQERISEKTLYEVALAGGFAGIIMGAKVYDHKTSKLSFWPPVGASVLLWIVVLSILVRDGLVALTF